MTNVFQNRSAGAPTLGDLLTARPSGLLEAESWAVLCQAVQALQDLFLSGNFLGLSFVAQTKIGFIDFELVLR